ncbi:sulfite exporter TauE/SafE family protein [Stenotrophobium rhamnosiphilum]|uniref:Probable membrane transporter protein n=1 Tax=Stenotrophobium rhamnosiphilum TaxID=2029166 RepID=A0A2T5MCS6_9GAMM|nr:sulfite exporter TauE/SafE family protein [Stenotrophobium rhamnosiphilum]PTU30373.1 sulfite exporter TauE/SafE family protein [Stenotrophobium rhamnosiphilum]
MSLLLGIAVGLVLGLTGAGGSILAVPLLMAALAWPMTQAVPVALLAVAAASALGSYLAWRKSYVRYRAAILMAVAGVLAAQLGLHAATVLPQSKLSLIFAVVLALVALRMLIQAWRSPEDSAVVRAAVEGDGEHAHGPICRLHPSTGRIVWTRVSALVIAMIGAVSGFLSGLLGVGGGFVIVPSLRVATELSMHSAVATSLMAIALTSFGTVGGALLQGRELPLMVALPFVFGALLGMSGGHALAPRIAGPRLQQGFAVLMLAIAVGMGVHAMSV